ncbi:MAG: cyclic nucleotide-binding domain-containing protein [Rhodocyclaceae bacterium]|jgi:CRP-like cAMP-binding protein|nr:cyclic nucleotide-binding domain-containing protein [Rhodocyclaceae bacterium]
MDTDVADALDGLDLFKGFSYPELKVVGRYLVRLSKKQGEVVFSEGEPGTYMLFLLAGRLSIVKAGGHGERLLCREGRGRMVGEMALLDQEPRSATCVADTECAMLALNVEALNRMADEYPLLAYRLMSSLAKILSRRLRRTSGMLVEFMEN